MLIGKWRSLTFKTEIFSDHKLVEFLELKADENNLNIIDFKPNGTFVSSGQFTVHEQGAELPVVMDDQNGTYSLSNDTIFLRLEKQEKEMIMTYQYLNERLLLRSEPLKLPEQGRFTADQNFVTTSIYERLD